MLVEPISLELDAACKRRFQLLESQGKPGDDAALDKLQADLEAEIKLWEYAHTMLKAGNKTVYQDVVAKAKHLKEELKVQQLTARSRKVVRPYMEKEPGSEHGTVA